MFAPIQKTIKYFNKLFNMKNKRNNSYIELNDPREFLYSIKIPKIFMDLPVKKGRYLGGFDLDRDGYSPCIVALRNLELHGDDQKSFCEVLKSYGEYVTIMNPNDKFGFSDDIKVFPDNHDPRHSILPWEEGEIDDRYERHKKLVRKENQLYGLDSEESIADLSSCSMEKLVIEAKRFGTLLESIRKNGYNPPKKSTIKANIYLAGDEYVWSVQGGHHRAAVLSYLGYTVIPVVIRKIIRREEVKFWPQVASGLYNKVAALHVFDNFFYARQPQGFQRWKESEAVQNIMGKS